MEMARNRLCMALCAFFFCSFAAGAETASMDDLHLDLLINSRAELMNGTDVPAPIRMFEQLQSKSSLPSWQFDMFRSDGDWLRAIAFATNDDSFGVELFGLRFMNQPLGRNVKFDFHALPSFHMVNYPLLGYDNDIRPVYSFLDAGASVTFFNAVTFQADGAFGCEFNRLLNSANENFSLGHSRFQVASETSLPSAVESGELRAMHYLFQVRSPAKAGGTGGSFFNSNRLSLKFDLNTGNTKLINSAGSVLGTGLTFIPFVTYRYSPFLGEMFLGGSYEVPPEWGWPIRPTGNVELALLHPLVRNASVTLDSSPLIMGVFALLADPRQAGNVYEFFSRNRNGYNRMKSPDQYGENDYFVSFIWGPTVAWGQAVDPSDYSRVLPYDPSAVLGSDAGVRYGFDYQMLMIQRTSSYCLSTRVFIVPDPELQILYTFGGAR